MVTKLTLSADEEIVKRAKRLAKEQGTSVSALFERFVRAATEGATTTKPLGPLTREAMGLASYKGKKSTRTLLEEALMDKYGVKR